MRNRTILQALLVSLFVSACAPSSPTVPTPVSPIQPSQQVAEIAQPTVTSTPVPLKEVDLAEALVPNDEMPPGLIGSKTKDNLPDINVPEPTKLIWQQLERGMEVAGGIRIYLYESKIDVRDAYQDETEMTGGFAKEKMPLSEVGESAQISYYTLDPDEIADSGDEQLITDLIFSRCYAVATIRVVDSPSQDEIVDLATRLDERLKTLVCREE